MNPLDSIHPSWNSLLPLLNTEEFLKFRTEILPANLYYPEKQNIFRVFSMPVDSIKVVIIGQDPYPGPGQANGRAFAVNNNVALPYSLKVIKNEVESNMQYTVVPDNWKTLDHWQKQGVFLLNTALTVEAGRPNSHTKYWEEFTLKVISFISQKNPCVWLLWGSKAQSFKGYISKPFLVKGYTDETITQIPSNPYMNYVLTAPHPAASAYSGGKLSFIGCKHFSYTNAILKNNKKLIINW